MGTSPSVMRAHQSGKSILNQINARQGKAQPVSVWFDEIESVIDSTKKDPVYLDFNTPALAIVLCLLEEGKSPSECLEAILSTNDYSHLVNALHVDQANTIYSYFSKKHTLRRVKGDFVSDWMNSVDQLCENLYKINKEHVRILVTLPRIFEYNKNIEAVMKPRKSVAKDLRVDDFESELKFVNSVVVHAQHQGTRTDYFWETPNKYLVRICIDHTDLGKPAWDFLARQGKIKLSTINCATARIKGYDFYVLHPNKKMEVNIA